MTDITFGIAYGSNDRIQVVCLDLGRFVDHHDLGTVASHGADRKTLDLRAVLQSTGTFISGQLHRPMTVRLNLTHDLGIPDEVVLYFLNNQRCLLSSARYNGDQTAGIQHANRNAALRRQPRLAIAAALDHHKGIGVTKLPSDNALGVLELDVEVFLNEHIKMCPPEMNLLCP